MTSNDEPTVAALRRLAADAPGDPWAPDAAAVLHRGRVLRARRTTGAATTGALVLALAIGVPAALAGHGTAGPVNPGQPTATTRTSPASATATEPGPSPTTPLGPVSVNAYGQSTYAVGAGQAAVLDVPNLWAVNVPVGSASPVSAQGIGGLDVTVTADGPNAVTVLLDAGASHGKAATVRLTWPAPEHPSDYSMSHHYPIPTVGTSHTDAFQYAYLVGTVPSWLSNPVVELVSDTAWTMPDGSSTHVAQVPTFRAPTPDGRLMYVITGAGAMALNWLANAHPVIAFSGGSDGAFVPGCEQNIGAYGCDLIPMPAQYLTGVPVQFSPAADQPTPVTTPPLGTRPATPAPGPTQLAAGVEAASGLSSRAGDLVAVDATVTGEYYLAGDLNGASVRVGVSTSGSPPQLAVFAESTAGTTFSPTAPPTWAPVTAAIPQSWARFPDEKARGFTAGITPTGAPRVFLVATWGFDLPNGTRTHALEVPTFAPPDSLTAALKPGQRLWVTSDVVAPSTVGSGWSGYVYAANDGTILDPSCLDAPGGADACARQDLDFGAYDEIRALLAG